MKKFEFSTYGVGAIKKEETVDLNGGAWWYAYFGVPGIVVGICISMLADSDTAEDFESGRQAARDFWGVN